MATTATPVRILNLAENESLIRDAFTTLNNQSYFSIEDLDGYLYPQDYIRQSQLWVTDQTSGGTRPINHSGTLLNIAGSIDNQLYFFTYEQTTASDGSTVGESYLWVTDGTLAGTQRLTGPNRGSFSELRSLARYTIEFDGQLVFTFGDGAGFEPWISDGTRAGTQSLADLQARRTFDIRYFAALGDRLLFSAETEDTGREMWVTDGTPTGTQLLLNISEGATSSGPEALGVVGDRLVFEASTRDLGRELWVTDGTTAGTQLLRDINPGPGSISIESYSENPYTPDGQLVFFANGDSGPGVDVWVTDGTTAGTQKLLDADIYFAQAIATDQKVFFTGAASTGETGFLGVTDGTVAGTQRLASIHFQLVDRPPNFFVTVPAILDDQALFRSGPDTEGGSELWISDGTVAGTRLLRDLNPTGSSFPFQFFATEDLVFFCANENELWVTDGTTAGTRRLMEGTSLEEFQEATGGNIPFYDTIPGNFTAINGKVYFQGFDTENGAELWVTDGTAEGTSLVADFEPGIRSSFPYGLSVVNNQLMFTTGADVWVLDPNQEEPILSGAGGRRTFTIQGGSGTTEIANFGGVGPGNHVPAARRAEVDTLKFVGPGLAAHRLLLEQQGADLVLTFERVADTRVVLKNFSLADLDNLSGRGNAGLGNILFQGQQRIQDSFDVLNADSLQRHLWRRNTVTFLNDRSNIVYGYNHSHDGINGQGGDDWINGRSGHDWLRGSDGDDILIGGPENDRLVGDEGADEFRFTSHTVFRRAGLGVDWLVDFDGAEGDRIGLSQTVFHRISRMGFNLRSHDFARISRDRDAGSSSARIVYNTLNGRLFYNENGAHRGLGQGGQFAVLEGAPELSHSSFTVFG